MKIVFDLEVFFANKQVPKTMEICLINRTEHASQYPGIFIFTTPSRMMRPVKNISSDAIELIGTMEQVYLHVALEEEKVVTGVSIDLTVLLAALFSS